MSMVDQRNGISANSGHPSGRNYGQPLLAETAANRAKLKHMSRSEATVGERLEAARHPCDVHTQGLLGPATY